MAIVYSYPTAPPESQDLLIGTEMAVQGGEGTPRTKTFTIGSIVDLVTPAIDLKANIESPNFTGTVTAPMINSEAISADVVTSTSFVKAEGLSTEYLMADGTISTMPTFQEVTTADPTITNTIYIDKDFSQPALIINGDNAANGLVQVYSSDLGPCIKAGANDGSSIYAANESGTAVFAITTEGTAIAAQSTDDFGTAIVVNGSNKGLLVTNGGVYISGLTFDGNYQLNLTANSAAKPSTNTWTVTSDERVKTNINPYTKGLETILAINPVTYDYNGKAGFDPTSTGNIGIIAQDVLNIIPESINTYQAKLNEENEEKTELYNFDSHALTFILINAIKQLNVEIELLKSK